MKRVELFDKNEIKKYSEYEETYQVLRNESNINTIKQINDQDLSDSYELIELAPKLFKNIRKMNKIESKSIMNIFSIRNLKHIEISLTKSKGGSFYIKPEHGQGRVLIKSITGK